MAVFRKSRRGARRAPVKARAKAMVPYARWDKTSISGVSVPRNILGFPGSLTTVIRYSDTFSVSSGGGVTPGGNIWRMNSVFDPDYTNLGHQALYFDQFAAVYDNYVVLGSKLDCTYSPLGDGAAPWLVGITTGNSTSFSSNTYTLQEQSKSVATILGDKDGTSVVSLSQSYSPKICLGEPTSDDTVQSGVTGNPAKQWFAYTWVSDRSGNSGSVVISVTITYRIRFFGMKNVNSS